MNPEVRVAVGVMIAAAGALAIGLERQWSGHATGPRARFAGVRTFTLLGMLSGIAGWLWSDSAGILAVILIGGAVALIVAAYVAASRRDPDGTTEMAALVVVAAGVTAGLGHWALAGGVSVVTTLLLVEKSRIHEIAKRIDATALRAAIRFGVMAIVVLPLLPEGPYGPWGGIRPRTLWLTVLMFSGLSFAGYAARLVFRNSAYSVAGILGGIISSTSVTLGLSRLSRSEGGQDAPLATGVVGASTVLFLRVLITTAVLNASLARSVATYFALPFLAGAALTAAGLWKGRTGAQRSIQTSNPLQFWASLQMALVFQVVLYLMHWVGHSWGGGRGLFVSAGILGLADVDALTISIAQGGHEAGLEVAAAALTIGILSNTVIKTLLTLLFGKGPFRWLAAGGLTVIGIALLASLAILR